MHFTTTLIAAATIALTAGAAAKAERLYGLTFDNRIVTFDSSTPDMILSSRLITGLQDGDMLVGLDKRPATDGLYSMSASGRIYALDMAGGTYEATFTGLTTTMPMGAPFGFDFNPVPDRLRVVSSTGQNLRINVDTGATIVDGMVSSDTGAVQLVGAAYTNSVAGATTTTLYAIDALSGSLLRSTNPNAGLYTGLNMMGEAFGPLGFSFTTENALGFDISGKTGKAFANIDSLLWSIDLQTGAGTALGIVGSGPLRSIAAGAAVPEPTSWAMLIAGFGVVGQAVRRRRRETAASVSD